MSRPPAGNPPGAKVARVASARDNGRRIGGATLWGTGALALAAVALAFGWVQRPLGDVGVRDEPLPGVTLDDDGADAMPVVTSLRSGGGAERAGLVVGDHIAAVDGHRVRDVAAARATVRVDRAPGIDLRVIRDGAVRRVAIDRRRDA